MILDVQSVSRTFRMGFWMTPLTVLHEINLQVPERSIFGFIGANGAGKTTLIHLIVGLHRPQGGRILVGGFEADTPQARSKIGYLPERPYFYEHLTGRQFLTYFGRLSGMAGPKIHDRMRTVLSEVGMSAAKDIELGKYSKGMLQRIGIAQAILHQPEFLVLDEPMSGLDPVGRKEMRELIVSLARQGHTVFFSTHVIPDVEAVCDRTAVIEKGKIKTSGSIKTLLSGSDQRVEIAFRGLSAKDAGETLGFVDLREIPEGVRGQVPAEKVDETLSALLRSHAQILWVNPVRPSLESQFDSTLGRDRGEFRV